MATTNKVTITLTRVELEHLKAAVDAAQERNQSEMGRPNPSLDRVQKKIGEVSFDAESEESAGEPAAAD